MKSHQLSGLPSFFCSNSQRLDETGGDEMATTGVLRKTHIL